MIKKYAAAALLLAAVPAVSGAAASQEASPAAAVTHTKRLLLHVTATRDLDQLHFAGTERVSSRSTGKFVGFDSFRGHVLPDRVVFETAFALKGGLLLTRVHTVGAAPPSYAGRVIGGTGAYADATGSVTGKAVGSDDTRLTITYQTPG